MIQTIIHKKINRTGRSFVLTIQNGQTFYLSLNSDIYSKFRPGDSLTDEQIQHLSATSLENLLNEYALRQIAISPKNRQILHQKLQQKLPFFIKQYKYVLLDTGQIITKIIDKLATQNLLNESDFASYLLSRHKNKSSFFQKRILRQKGIDSDIVSNLFSRPDSSGQIALITNLVNKYRLRYQNMPKYQQNQKILNLLYNRGFPLSLAKPIVDQIKKER